MLAGSGFSASPGSERVEACRFNANAKHRKGVEEIRIWDEAGTFRAIYPARMADLVYVLYAFQKKTQKTSQRDIDKAKARFAELSKERR